MKDDFYDEKQRIRRQMLEFSRSINAGKSVEESAKQANSVVSDSDEILKRRVEKSRKDNEFEKGTIRIKEDIVDVKLDEKKPSLMNKIFSKNKRAKSQKNSQNLNENLDKNAANFNQKNESLSQKNAQNHLSKNEQLSYENLGKNPQNYKNTFHPPQKSVRQTLLETQNDTKKENEFAGMSGQLASSELRNKWIKKDKAALKSSENSVNFNENSNKNSRNLDEKNLLDIEIEKEQKGFFKSLFKREKKGEKNDRISQDSQNLQPLQNTQKQAQKSQENSRKIDENSQDFKQHVFDKNSQNSVNFNENLPQNLQNSQNLNQNTTKNSQNFKENSQNSKQNPQKNSFKTQPNSSQNLSQNFAPTSLSSQNHTQFYPQNDSSKTDKVPINSALKDSGIVKSIDERDLENSTLAKNALLQGHTALQENKNLSLNQLIFITLALFLTLAVFAPQIYIRNNIYYLSRDIATLRSQESVLNEENKQLRRRLETMRYQNQILDYIE